MQTKNMNRQCSPLPKHPILKKTSNFDSRLPNNSQNHPIKTSAVSSKYNDRKKRSHSKSKHSINSRNLQSNHVTFDKKQDRSKKCGKKDGSSRKKLFELNQMQIVESKEFKELCNLEKEYRKTFKSGYDEIKWLIPTDELHKHSFSTFPDYIKEEDFNDLNNLSINFLHFVCKRRIIRDQEFDYIYEGMVIKFPEREQEIKKVLIDVLSLLET